MKISLNRVKGGIENESKYSKAFFYLNKIILKLSVFSASLSYDTSLDNGELVHWNCTLANKEVSKSIKSLRNQKFECILITLKSLTGSISKEFSANSSSSVENRTIFEITFEHFQFFLNSTMNVL